MAGFDWGVPWTFIAMDYPRGNNFYVQCVWKTFLYLKNFQLKIPRHWSLNLFSCPLLSQLTYLLVQCLLTLRAQTEANRLHVSL